LSGNKRFAEIFLLMLSVACSGEYSKCNPVQVFEVSSTQELRAYRDSQILYNGRVWYRKHSNVRGNEFFESALWTRGDVVINGRTFRDNDLRYDILNDELLIRRADGVILILNSMQVTDFTLFIGGNTFYFRNFRISKSAGIDGYANVLYDGKTTLLLKPVKEILPLGYKQVDDIFVQTDYLYVLRKGVATRIRGNKGLMDLFGEKRKEIRSHIRAGRLNVLVKEPVTVIPVLRYYDTLPD